MRLLFHIVFGPLFIMAVFMTLFLIGYVTRRNRMFISFLTLFIAWFFLTTFSPLPKWLIYNLESRYPVFDPTRIAGSKPVMIMVLGGGHSTDPTLPATAQLSGVAIGRLVEAIRIHVLIPSSKLVCSGYSNSGRTSQAEMVALAAMELGVDPADTLMLVSPANTAEEADRYYARFGDSAQLILVTDAAHMPRAMRIFESTGLQPISAPANFFAKIDPEGSVYDFKPSVSKIHMMENAMHEYIGLLELALR